MSVQSACLCEDGPSKEAAKSLFKSVTGIESYTTVAQELRSLRRFVLPATCKALGVCLL